MGRGNRRHEEILRKRRFFHTSSVKRGCTQEEPGVFFTTETRTTRRFTEQKDIFQIFLWPCVVNPNALAN